MPAIRYGIVFGVKDTADRYLPLGEFYMRGLELDGAKQLFKKLPNVSGGDFVFRLYERYYDKHTQMDINYQKSEFTLETDEKGFHLVLDALLKLQEQALED